MEHFVTDAPGQAPCLGREQRMGPRYRLVERLLGKSGDGRQRCLVHAPKHPQDLLRRGIPRGREFWGRAGSKPAPKLGGQEPGVVGLNAAHPLDRQSVFGHGQVPHLPGQGRLELGPAGRTIPSNRCRPAAVRCSRGWRQAGRRAASNGSWWAPEGHRGGTCGALSTALAMVTSRLAKATTGREWTPIGGPGPRELAPRSRCVAGIKDRIDGEHLECARVNCDGTGPWGCGS